MPKISIYLSDALYERARRQQLAISALAQEAIERALADGDQQAWVRRVRGRPPLVASDLDTSALMHEVREEFGA